MSLKVLICDDVADLRSLYRVMLDPEPDIEVVGEAADGEEAVFLIHTLHPDLILLDINMPKRNGLEVLLDIRRHYPETKVIMLTGMDSPHLRKCAADLGALDYVVKGMEIHGLAERVRLVAA